MCSPYYGPNNCLVRAKKTVVCPNHSNATVRSVHRGIFNSNVGSFHTLRHLRDLINHTTARTFLSGLFNNRLAFRAYPADTRRLLTMHRTVGTRVTGGLWKGYVVRCILAKTSNRVNGGLIQCVGHARTSTAIATLAHHPISQRLTNTIYIRRVNGLLSRTCLHHRVATSYIIIRLTYLVSLDSDH